MGSAATSEPSSGSDASSAASDHALFEPAGLPNLPANSIPGELSLFASTLLRTATGYEFYAAVRNEGSTPLCGAGILLDFYDHADQVIGTAGGGVSGSSYRFVDGSGTIACVEAEEVAMAWVTNVPTTLVLEELAYVMHRFPAFAVDVEPLPGLSVTEIEAIEVQGGVAFRGSVVNTGDAAITEPSVSVFPMNTVGRPLGMATGTATIEIPPGGTWMFETSTIATRGSSTFAVAGGARATNP